MEETKDGFREELKSRIKYLVTTEFEELAAIDKLAARTLEREMKWKLINELADRRHELEDTLKMYDKHTDKIPKSLAECMFDMLSCFHLNLKTQYVKGVITLSANEINKLESLIDEVRVSAEV